MPDYGTFSEIARRRDPENKAFCRHLKWGWEGADQDLDELVSRVADEAGARVDCTQCGRCCRDLTPYLSHEDQVRLAAGLGTSLRALRLQYLERQGGADGEESWCFAETPCVFLRGNRCSVYRFRPEACRSFPGLYAPGFRRELELMTLKARSCPWVFEVFEGLKQCLKWTG